MHFGNNFDNCCQYEHIKQIKYKVEPMIDHFQIKINNYDKSHIEMKEIIKRFDEVLLEKASKFSIEQIRSDLSSYTKHMEFKNFIQKFKELDKEVTEKFIDVTSSIEKSRDDMLTEMEIKTSNAFREIKKQVLDSLGGKPVDINELKTLLLVKADRSEVGILDKIKADRDDTNKFEDMLQFMFTQIEHLLTLVIANLKMDLPNSYDTENTRINK